MDGTGRLPPARADSVVRHAIDTMRLASPLAIAQLAQMAMGITDTVLLGSLGGDALAAGGLGESMFITVCVVLQGVLTSIAVLVSQARGAGRDADVPGLYWTGLLLTLLLIVPAFALFSAAEPLLLAVGEPAVLAHDVGRFVGVLHWATPGALLGLGLMRAFLPAVDRGGMILWVSLGTAAANGALCYGFVHGAWGLPALGLRGPALATVLSLTAGALALLVLLHGRPALRRLVRWRRPQFRLLGAMLRVGIPVSATFAVETGLFLTIALLIGRLGPVPLAAQQVALNIVSISFMVPLAIAQAANVRVGHRVGAGDGPGARRAGLVAIGLGAAFEGASALFLLAAPTAVIGLYLDPALPGNAETFAIAVGLVSVAVVFQVADGMQSVASGALRGLGDTRVPFLLAAAGYWGVGFPAAWFMTMRAGWGAAGAWWGLAASLMAVAVMLTRRFLQRTRAVRPAQAGVRSPAMTAVGSRLVTGASGQTYRGE